VSRALGNRGFTLLELILAVSLLAIASTVIFMVFFTATRAWKRGVALADSLHHGDFVADQLTLALRSAYYPDTGAAGDEYGFWMEDGAGASPQDQMSWVKIGGALVGSDWPAAGSPHRVIVSVEPDQDGQDAICVRAWRPQGEPEEFDPVTDVEPVVISRRVHGINCRPAYRLDDGTIEWRDEWEDTNRIPTAVEVTLYVDAVDEGEPPVEVKRVVSVPVAQNSWDVRRPASGVSRPPLPGAGGRPHGAGGAGQLAPGTVTPVPGTTPRHGGNQNVGGREGRGREDRGRAPGLGLGTTRTVPRGHRNK
jgi:prepilin-type N-terminal cleavage/methylation domain-containing protein